MQYIVGL